MNRKFSFFASKFLTWAKKCRHATTVNVYRHYFEKFVKENGDLPLKKINAAQVSGWADTWHASQAIVRLFRWCCVDAELIRVNPVAGVRHPPKGCRKRTATKKETATLLRGSPADLRALLVGYRESWARPGELRAATWADVHPKTTRAELRKALVSGRAFIVLYDYKNRKGRRLPNEPRVILISPRLGRLLARLMPHALDQAAEVFQSDKGKKWTANAVRCRLRRLRRELAIKPDRRGENIVPYTFRHTGATEAAAAGIRDRVLADVLGHVETSTTARYQHLLTEHLQDAMQAFWHRHGGGVKIPAAIGRPR